jgi:hypothetical protein
MAVANWSNLMLSVPVDITASFCTWYAEEFSKYDVRVTSSCDLAPHFIPMYKVLLVSSSEDFSL